MDRIKHKSSCITDLQQLQNYYSPITLFSPSLQIIILIESVDCKIVYLFRSRRITLSMCIAWDKCLAISLSSCESCFFPFVNGQVCISPP